jgi:hypothetical protein
MMRVDPALAAVAFDLRPASADRWELLHDGDRECTRKPRLREKQGSLSTAL